MSRQPEKANQIDLPLAEAIVNAVMHRDYTGNASVQVMLFAGVPRYLRRDLPTRPLPRDARARSAPSTKGRDGPQ